MALNLARLAYVRESIRDVMQIELTHPHVHLRQGRALTASATQRPWSIPSWIAVR